MTDPRLDLATGGGKGVNLGRLTREGFPVPAGFVVSTDAYRHGVAEHDLRRVIEAALAELGGDARPALDAASDTAAAEAVSQRIREAFRAASIPQEIAVAVRAAYQGLAPSTGATPPAVAVRSSATAEDLPELSFAGQQDTFLHVVGADAVLDAVRDCWSSLWTARAIEYRRRAGIGGEVIALAAVVQLLVPAEISGVLFTADPVSGHRGRMVIDATHGLGEALVSGQVEPDHLVADARTGAVLSRVTGAKAVVTEADPIGGVRLVENRAGAETALDDAQVAELVALGARVQAAFQGSPQDIEWAWSAGRLHLLQARAVTSLHPVPDGAPPESVWLSFGAVQGMLAPMTPLGREVIATVLSAGATLFGRQVDFRYNPVIATAGERLWIRLDLVLRHPIGQRVARTALPYIDPSAKQIVDDLSTEPWLAPLTGAEARRARARFAHDLSHFARRVLGRVPGIVARPEAGRDGFDAAIAGLLVTTRASLADAGTEPDPIRRVAARARATGRSLSQAFPTIAPWVAPMIVPSIAALRLISRLTEPAGPGDPGGADSSGHGHGVSPLAMQVTRSVPRNPTTEMDLALWDVAAAIRADDAARAVFDAESPAQLAARHRDGTLPTVTHEALEGFLRRFGMRGVGEIDIGRPRWREDPTDLLQTLAAYLTVPPEQSPRRTFEAGEVAAAQAITQLQHRTAGMPRGAPRAHLIGLLARRVRAFTGAREQPKFTVIQIMGVCREALLASGADLVELDLLDHADDICFLRLAELLDLPGSDLGRLRGLVAARRAAYQREWSRARVPRVLVGDGRAFHEGLSRQVGDADLVGSPVSPGVVEGLVRVVHDPAQAGLRRGEILVCVGTDPAWTPLFLTAAGLVTEVGGMMTHGSVVAREYGIPGVVGVHEATTRLRTGDRIRLDGSAGTIELLASPSERPSERP